MAQLPADQKERIKAAITAVATPRPGAAAAAAGPAPAAGAKKDPELTEEQMANIRKAFDAIDSSKNGTIEAREFKTAMEALGMGMSDEEVKAVFGSFDINGDSKLQFEEYVNLIKDAMKDK